MLNLDPRYYVDPAIYDRERTELFARTWQLLGPVSQVAQRGEYCAVEIAGHKVFAIRGRDGKLRGFRNLCRHRGARLLEEGNGRCPTIRCPYHQWVWADDGRLMNVPWFGEDADFKLEDWRLAEIPVAEWRGLLFIAIEPSLTLEQQLGDLVNEIAGEPVESYTPMRTERMVFDANWKIYTDNFVEGYHIPGIHPQFFAAIDFEQFKTTAHDGLIRMTAPPRDGLFYRGKWLWMWPNWTLSLFDGGMNTSRINPLGPNQTELIYHFYFADTSEAKAQERDALVARNLDIVREDFEICLATHKNYASGAYTPGPLSPRHEAGVAYFQDRIRHSLGPTPF